jgi:RimJ/RimL family protein N-acetyltransferase
MITIRKAGPKDAAHFRELRLEALLDSPVAFSMDHQRASIQSMKYWEEMLTMDDAESALFLAEQEHHLIAMTGVARGRSPKTRHTAEIWGVYVQPEWRGLHVAEELIRSCIEWAKERGVIVAKLGVAAVNKSAIRCYERCGFTKYATEARALFHEGRYYDFDLMAVNLDVS